MIRSSALLLLAIAALVGSGCTDADDGADSTAPATPAELVLTGGRIYTVDQGQPWAEAVVIDDGQFVFVGSDEDAEAYIGDTTTHHDLDGELVVPGLTDAHTHPGLVAILGGEDEAPVPKTSLEDIQAWLAGYAADNQELIVDGCCWPNTLFGADGPQKEWLDEVVPDRPVSLYDESGHSQWMNSAMLELLGVDAGTPDPAPGLSEFVRDADGEPTGWVREFAAVPFVDELLLPEEDVLHAELDNFVGMLADQGVTSLMDGGNLQYHDEVYSHLADLEARGELPLRYEGSFHIFLPEQADVAVAEVNRLRDEYGGERLTFDTIKIHYDGVLETGTAAVLDPYTTGPDATGAQLLTGERVTELLVEMQGEDMNLHVHTVGDRAVRTILDAVEAAQDQMGGPLDARVTLSHVELLDEADVDRFAELDVVANFTPHWHGEYGVDPPSSEALTGPERSEIKHRARLLHDADAVVTYSSDVIDLSEVERANPYFGIQTGHTRQEPAAGADAPVTPPAEQVLSIEQLIAGYTANAAYQLGWEDRLGSIEAGKIADLVVLDQNLFEIDPYDIADTTPIAVVMDGAVVSGELTG